MASGDFSGGSFPRSALNDADRKASRTGFLIFIAHITARFEHRLNRLIERNIVTAVARHGKPGRGNRLRSRHRVAFNTRNLDLTRHRVACEPQMMLNTDFRRVLDLVGIAAHHRSEAACRHGAGDTHFTLTPDLSA
mgnify:CR=1 FL=1